jgi:2-phospho-L-lactate guanylyltransferase
VLAIVPVKGRDGKNRLEGLLRPEERARLVEAMLTDVLEACRGARFVDRVVVVTPDPEAVPAGVEVLEDDGRGHAAAVERALEDGRAGEGALVVMGDCPLVTGAALDRLARAAQPVALAPSRDGGVNGLALRDPRAAVPVFGVRNAARATLERARAGGVEPAVVDEPALAFDVDHPADVWRLRQEGGATATHRVLAEILPPTGGLL